MITSNTLLSHSIKRKISTEMDDWLRIDPNKASRDTLNMYRSNSKLIDELFPKTGERLEFGTAGLRAAFGPGYLRMNEVVVMQTSLGLLRQLEADFGRKAIQENGIVIGYDHRCSKEWGLSSKGFALAAACVFLAEGYEKIYLFDKLNPTPFVPFAIQHFKCLAGFMMTASHNPKQDAGFKVYWNNACQIVAPVDELVSKKILENLILNPKSVEFLNAGEKGIFTKLSNYSNGLCDVIKREYIQQSTSKFCRSKLENNRFTKKICYTAMHGVGSDFVISLFEAFGHQPLVIVPSQAEPDYEFSTVKFPNPEEKGALDLAIKHAEQFYSNLVISTDPDADRLGVAEYDPILKSWYIFTGDEIAMLSTIRSPRQKPSASS